ncbi:TPA: sulfate transporter, partial [Legionella pneumophila]|nr:sulfate transporter [Legionella pneumophila]
SAGLALIIEARKLCKQNNKVFEVIGISPETQSLAEFCGVKTILQTS